MSKRKIFCLTVIIMSLIMVIAGCASQQESQQKKEEITLGYVNWAEGIAMTHLGQAIIEDKLGYEVKTTMADVGPTFQGMTSGDIDAFMDVWLPVTHKDYIQKLEDDIKRVGINYKGARIGLVVPEYVDADSISELNNYKNEFKQEITGIDAGAGIMKATNKAIKKYNLDFDLLEGSGPAMAAALKKAIDNQEWIVVTGWRPHWKFARWDLKFLKDPKQVYGEVENLYTYSRKGLKEDAPDVYKFLKNFNMNTSQLGDLMGKIADAEDKETIKVAREWMNNHQALVNSWLNK